jgi:hypothetical protein
MSRVAQISCLESDQETSAVAGTLLPAMCPRRLRHHGDPRCSCRASWRSVVAIYGLCEHAKHVLPAPQRPETTSVTEARRGFLLRCVRRSLHRTAIALTQNSPTPRMKLVGRVASDEEGHTLADPAQCKRQAQTCVRFAQKARSAQEKRALLRLARTWSSLAAQTEAYEAILCKFDELAVDDKRSRLQ